MQYGHSLACAKGAQTAIGVDPYPQVRPTGNQIIHNMLSDDFFVYLAPPELVIDFAFIDGSHLFEDALRDFMNIEKHSHPRTVVVFDDVLPYNQEVGGRHMVPGHWAGDVWKVKPILDWVRNGSTLQSILVNTQPTGALLVWGLDPGNKDLPLAYPVARDTYLKVTEVPFSVTERQGAVSIEEAVRQLAQWWAENDQ